MTDDSMDAGSPAADAEDFKARLAEALRFLGHDAREGHSSTLALLELQRIKPDPMTLAQLTERVEANARKSLTAIDDFMDLSRARSQPLRPGPVDLVDLLVEVVADAWPAASRVGMRIQVAEQVDTAPTSADADLLRAAFAKLLRDAIARGPRGADIVCSISAEDGGWAMAFDLPSELVPAVPEGSSTRAGGRVHPPPPSLVLAQAVASRHGGALLAQPGNAGRSSVIFRLSSSEDRKDVPKGI